jgi:thioredoxin reductase (NADPH)
MAKGSAGILPVSSGILPGDSDAVRPLLGLGSSRQDTGKGGQDARAALVREKTSLREASHRVSRSDMEQVTIIGSGCAGLTAAIYTARANLSPLVLEGGEPGGQLSTTTLVENFPGFPDGVDGPGLIMQMKAQAQKFGARFQFATVTGFERAEGFVRLQLGGEAVETRSLIVASGASARYLGLDREREMIGHGLTSCATCDGAFYRNVPVCVVGGGDSACEEAVFLTRFASKVYLIHRRNELRASKIMADRALSNPKIEMIWDTIPTRYLPDDQGEMRAVGLKNVKTGAETELEVACVFAAIGHTPNTAPFKGHLDMDEKGYLVQGEGTRTNIAGVFAAGDVADPVYRQAITAAGQGCAAALDAERYLAASEG